MKNNLDFYRDKLSEPAGLQAQLLMAPHLRKAELEKYNNILPQQKSAVLILIYIDKISNRPHIVLTLRSKQLRNHSGQVSFPGGKMDKADKNLEETALREASEEIGIDRNLNIEIIGKLSPLLIPITGFKVYPIVAFISEMPKFIINPNEVEKLLLVAVDDLVSTANVKEKVFAKTSSSKGHQAPYFEVNGVEIWGATAMILSELIITAFPNSDFANHSWPRS